MADIRSGPNKIIFLDWDGVLATRSSYEAAMAAGRSLREPPFDPACVAAFGRLIEATSAKVVLTTSWRTVGSVACGEWLNAAGIVCELAGCTPWITTASRRTEINCWLSGGPWPVEYVVIDDSEDADLRDGSFVRTDMDHGLTEAHVARAIALLNRDSSRPRASGAST